MKSKIIFVLCGLFLTGLAQAECSSTLNKEALIKCQAQEASDTKNDMAKKATISPITGKDVTTVAPAAGKAATKPAK